jgi:hypothetical protein
MGFTLNGQRHEDTYGIHTFEKNHDFSKGDMRKDFILMKEDYVPGSSNRHLAVVAEASGSNYDCSTTKLNNVDEHGAEESMTVQEYMDGEMLSYKF